MVTDVAEIKNTVMELYVGFLGRAADQDGFSYWVNEIHSGKLTFDNLRASFATIDQPEYWNIYGALSNRELAIKVYQNLLNREPDTAGLTYWVDELDTGKIEPSHFINAIINAVKDQPSTANSGRLLDIDTLQNKVLAANFFTQESQTVDPNSSAFLVAAKAAVAPVSSDLTTVPSSYAKTITDLNLIPKEASGIKGTPGDDVLKSAEDVEWFEPGDGSDNIISTGKDSSLDYWNASAAVTIDMEQGTTTGASVNDTFSSNIVRIEGSAFDDVLTGGNAANDNWEAFNGGNGDDTIQGGSGWDELLYHSSNPIRGVVVDFSSGLARDNYNGTDTFSGIESVRGTYFADTFIGGNQQFTTFKGLAGNDTFQGIAHDTISDTGWERVDYSRDYKSKNENGDIGDQSINVDLSMQTATDGFGNTDTLINIDQIKATKYNDTLKGDVNNNRFEGGDGSDRFIFIDSWGRDRITDFVLGEDKLDFSLTTVTFDQFTMTYVPDDDDLHIDLATGDSIRLNGIELLQSSDFIFA